MVSRGIWDHPEFAPSEFSEREAFLWLVSEAAWKPRTARAGRVVVDLDRGQLCASVRFIAAAWGWSKSRVDRFLKRLENRDMLTTSSGTGQLVITLCNYDKFQSFRDASGTQAGHDPGHERDTIGTNYKKGKQGKHEEETVVSLVQSTPKPRRNDTSQFDEFWTRYPRKVGKGAAQKAYAKAVKAIAHDDLMFALSRQLAGIEAKDPQFRPHPATWLNSERWNDEPEPAHDPRGHMPSRPGSGMVDAFAAVAARRLARDGRG